MTDPPRFQRLVRAARRRWIVCRAVEAAGIGALVGAMGAILLTPILIWRASPAHPVVAISLGAGALAGFLFSLTRRPGLLATAIEIDRQLGLHDLLGTAQAGSENRDEWMTTVLGLADERCRSIAPSALVLRRLGSRAWGGIGLGVALSIVLGMLSASPTVPHAVAVETNDSRWQPPTALDGPRTQPFADLSAPARRSPDASSDSHDDVASDQPADRPDVGTAQNIRSDGAGSSDGRGSGSQGSSEPRRTANPAREAASGGRTAPGTLASGGTGAAGDGISGAPDATGISARANASSPPPWQSPTWSQSRGRALELLKTDRIPPEYRELVRDYFSPDFSTGPR